MKIDAVFGDIVTFATISFNNNKVLKLVLEQLVGLFFFVFISQRSTRPISQWEKIYTNAIFDHQLNRID